MDGAGNRSRSGGSRGGTHHSSGRRRSRERAPGSAWARFRHDVRDVRERYAKQTSVAHKRFVLLLIIAGAALRVWLATKPITAQEAIAYMDYARLPIGETISNYSLPINNVLHTVLTKWSTGIFGVSLIALRLPALIAGVLVLPFFYLFVRSMFNRYIALMALALVASSPCLMELSALAHGYSLTWLFMVLALVFGRHLVRENNAISAIALGLCCALCVWSVPSSITACLMVLLWALFSILTKYERSLGERAATLGHSLLVFLAAAALFYLPVILSHGVDQLFHHATEEEHTWKDFSINYVENVMRLWVWIVDPTAWWVAVLGFAGLVHAAYISAKFRTLVIAMAVGAIPLSLILANGGEPWQWSYALFIFHLGMAIALFYLLKFVQDKLINSFGKRTRTAWASLIMLVGFAWPGMGVVEQRVQHLPEADACALFLAEAMSPSDGLCTDAVWRAPLDFAIRAQGTDPGPLHRSPQPGHELYVVLAPRNTEYPMALLHCKEAGEHYAAPVLVKDWQRMETFAARSMDAR